MKQIIYIANSEGENIEVWILHEYGNMELIQKVQTNGQVQPISIIQKKFIICRNSS